MNNHNVETRKTGKVKFMNNGKGFGFLIAEDGSELFVHITNIDGKVSMGDAVVFDAVQSSKGPKAINVSRI